jgi:uncharacterized damage-inducible protein DinB
MTAVELLKEGAEFGHGEFKMALEGLSENHAWARLPPAEDDYLHTDGSIYGIAMHVASVKYAYGSICFRNTEIRWRDIADQIEKFEFSWPATLEYLELAHQYWMESWADLTPDRLNEMRPTNFKTDWPAWKLIRLMNQHDSYHAGQIAVIRYAVKPSSEHPESQAEDIRKYCADSKHW